jgi:hypothetical protein
MKKYFISGLSAFVLEVASTFYIKTVSDRSVYMLVMAFIGPFLSLPFGGYMVESKIWGERVKLTFAVGIGYFFGALLVYLLSYENPTAKQH